MTVCGGLGFIHSSETRSTLVIQSRVDAQPPVSTHLSPYKKTERVNNLYNSNNSFQIITPPNIGGVRQCCCKLPYWRGAVLPRVRM